MIGAAAIAVSCSTGASLVSCSGTLPRDDGGTDAAQDGMIAAYGGPFDATALDSASDAAGDAKSDATVAAYGGPPQDAGGG